MALITQSDSPLPVSPSRGIFAAATLAELKTFTVPLGNQTVEVDGSVSRGDGLAGTYYWNATDSRADNGTTIIASNAGGVGRWNLVAATALDSTFTPAGAGAVARSVADDLADRVSVFRFMTAAQIADVRTNAGAIDVSAALASAFATGRLLYAPAGTYRVNNAAFTALLGGGLVGDGRTTIFKLYGYTADKTVLTGAGNNLFRDFAIIAGDTLTYTKTYETWTAYNYTANNHATGIFAASNTDIICVYFQQIKIGVFSDGTPGGAVPGTTGIRILNCSSLQTSDAALQLYYSAQITVTGGTYVLGGAIGGIMFPSCQDVAISGSYVFNPESTGINPGGAVTANLKRVSITGNTVTSGDCIGCENGAENLTITGNTCAIAGGYVTNLDITGINVQMHQASTGQDANITITGNTVYMIDTAFAYKDFLGVLIDVGGVVGGQPLNDLTISGNNLRGGETGIYVHGLVGTVNSNVAITGNNCTHNFYGVKVERMTGGFIGANNFRCGKTVTTAGTYGVYFVVGDNSDIVLSGNATVGYQFHIQQDVPGGATNLNCTRVVVQSHTYLANPGDSGAFTEFRNSGSGTDVNLRALQRFQQGVATANNLVLGRQGNKFALTGVVQINLIDNREWNNGDIVQLHAQGGATTVKNGTASSGNNKTVVTSTGADWVSGAGGFGVLTLVCDTSIPGWREVARVG